MICAYILSVILAGYLMSQFVLDRENGKIMLEDILPILIASLLSPIGILVGIFSRLNGKKVIWERKK